MFARDHPDRRLADLPEPLRALQCVRVAAAFGSADAAAWDRELRGLVAGLPRPARVRDGDPSGAPGFSGRARYAVPAEGLSLSGARGFDVAGDGGPGRPSDTDRKFFIHLTDCEDFTLDGLRLRAGRNGVLLHRCKRFRVSDVEMSGLEGYGIILFDCEGFSLENVRAAGCLSSAVMALGRTGRGRIAGLRSVGGRGFENRDAGLHLNHCTPDLGVEHVPEACHERRPIREKIKRPHLILVEGAHLEGHRAQGIYLEGAAACTIRGATILRNNKEGICFDWGTALCRLERSRLSGNGERAGLTPDEIRADFIEHHPLLADGSSSAKLPAVSFDNAAFNTVRGCIVTGNHGGAFKTVRASCGTRLILNVVRGNDRGNNAFQRFRWLNEPGPGRVRGEFGTETPLLDLGPSGPIRLRANLVADADRVLAPLRRAIRLWRSFRRG